MIKNQSILCIGQIVADVVVRPVDSLPVPGQLNEVAEIRLVPGGCSCNTACVLARLGANAALSGVVSNDLMSEAILREIARLGVDTQYVDVCPEISASSVVVVVDGEGERSFLYKKGGTEAYSGRGLTKEVLSRFGILHMGGSMKLESLDRTGIVKLAKESGCFTSIDTDWDPTGRWLGFIEGAMAHCDVLFTNHIEGKLMTGKESIEQIAFNLKARGPKTVVVKDGENGCFVLAENELTAVPGYKVKVVDTTCAGDSFVAAYLYGVLEGLDPVSCARLGNAAGALCTTAVSHSGIGSISDLYCLMKQQEG